MSVVVMHTVHKKQNVIFYFLLIFAGQMFVISKNTKPIYNLLFTKEIFAKMLNVHKKCKSKLGKLKKNRVINTKKERFLRLLVCTSRDFL